MAEAKFSVKKIREALEKQLKENGMDVLHCRELIDSYLYFYAEEKKMRADVKANGYWITVTSAQGKECEKENPSVKNAVAYNKQRLQILKELGLTAAVTISLENNDDL